MIFVLKLTGGEGSGSTYDFYFGSHGFMTLPTDTPPNTPVVGCLERVGVYERSLDKEMPIGAMQRAYGVSEFNNGDGQLDYMFNYGWKNRPAEIYAKNEPGGAFPDDWVHVMSATLDSVSQEGDTLKITWLDGMYSYLDKNVCASFLGTGGLEGPSELKGVAKPRVYGSPFNAGVVLIDKINDIYMASDKQFTAPQTVFEGRNAIPKMSVNWDDAANFTALQALSVPSGQAGRCSTYSLVKLGSVPVLPLSADPCRIISGFPTLYERTALGKVVKDLATDAGISSGNIDPGIESAVTNPCGLYFQDLSTKYASAFDYVARGYCCWVGFTRLNVLKINRWATPVGTPVYEFNTNNLLDLTSVSVILPCRPLRVESPKNYKTMSEGDVATVNPPVIAQSMTREYLGSTEAVPSDLLHIGDKEVVIQSPGYHNNSLSVNFPAGNPGQTAASLFSSCFCGHRVSMQAKASMSLELIEAVDVGDLVSVTWDRYELQSGRLFRVSGLQYDFDSLEMTFTLWG